MGISSVKRPWGSRSMGESGVRVRRCDSDSLGRGSSGRAILVAQRPPGPFLYAQRDSSLGVISVRRYLVVANQTLGGPKLADKLRECMSAGPCRFYLVVPATPTSQFLEPISQPLSLSAVDGGGGMLPDYTKIAKAVARRRLDTELARRREAGAEADGEVGDPRPLHAIRDALTREQVDEIIVSTLPHRL